MEPYYAGWLSLVPPILAITLALISKEVVFSLLTGILSGTFIYSIGIGLNPAAGTVGTALDLMADSADLYIIFFVSLLGALVYVISMAGGSKAYGKWASSKIKSRKLALAATALLGIIIFIDDYFNCLTVGTVMKPLTDKYKVSRAKLAYIIDCTAAPVCIISPISSWAAAVGSNLEATGFYANGFKVFLSTIPMNLYAILSIIMIFMIIVSGKDYGPMTSAESMAEKGFLGAVRQDNEMLDSSTDRGTVGDMLLPIVMLIVFSVLAMLYTGGFFTTGPSYMSFGTAFGSCETSKSLAWGGLGALFIAMIMFVPRNLMTFRQFMNGVTEGIKTMIPACCILFLAWTIGAVCRDILQTPEFVSSLLAQANIPKFLLPAMVFVIAAFLSFSTGTAWGTFSILIPIIAPVANILAPELLTVSLSATLAGSVFGDNCSPISDTTILSSAGTECNHIDHVTTQLPYALTVAACCFAGYITAGLSGSNMIFTLAVSVACLAAAFFTLYRIDSKRKLARRPADIVE
ncbi:Na+/H+ antiporter NhaC family protein [Lacrimispora saccharolytica]|uniref:Na+/H+ antiporter NhaC-like protein n=1 Tax=Lacrimispora saccharolytica (strain ATCC 35040 / DSM 2544 / NRCC 2533 / WM1) TaxID=610130 RepID=D9R9K9_LACSW|nr:Na+/H+ antiporter NhaC family protein [Lacrimispora saccharolytica]ADL04059.1 Na+/H+ antiporter NhaC-like protein [[Clostridium] saccharolyticum WM1]QRV21643.1 Na+/H+ antiporter NhaC family protein [Lacrimispora saccharolytica]